VWCVCRKMFLVCRSRHLLRPLSHLTRDKKCYLSRARDILKLDMDSNSDLRKLDDHLSTRNCIDGGVVPSVNDVAVFDKLTSLESIDGLQHPHVHRFFSQWLTVPDHERDRLKKSPSPLSPTSSAQVLLIQNLLGDDKGVSRVGHVVRVGGWVRTVRDQKQTVFVQLGDGSSPHPVQLLIPHEVMTCQHINTGTSLVVEGEVQLTPASVKDAKQLVEIHVTSLHHVGECESSKYPIAKTRLSLEYLRTHLHLRPRTNTIGCVLRIRNALAMATHGFFQKHGFALVHTPILTGSDCEGAGEMFQTTTLLKPAEEESERQRRLLLNNLDALEKSVAEKEQSKHP